VKSCISSLRTTLERMNWPELAILVAAQLVTAGAIYGGIRSDLLNMKDRQVNFEKRLEDHLKEDAANFKEIWVGAERRHSEG
jgi:hypothetical protein